MVSDFSREPGRDRLASGAERGMRGYRLIAGLTTGAMLVAVVSSGCGGGARAGGNGSRAEHPPAGLTAYLNHPLLRAGEACPITRPDPRVYTASGTLRSILKGDLRDLYGRGPLAVILPLWHPNISRDPHDRWFRTKVAWWSDVRGVLHIVARRIDQPSAMVGRGDIAPPAPTGAHRIEPTNILLPAPGCWEVAGRVGRAVLTWIFRARA